MDISYKKINNKALFNNFEDPNLLNMANCKNYIPLYNTFFELNENNYNSINLNNEKNLYSITKKKTENIFSGTIKDEKDNIIEKDIFFKLCPLLDPFKYMAGQYDMNNINLLDLPKFSNNSCHYKMNNSNNSAYVDSFFTYLTSQLYNRLDFFHGLDFYGSYIGYKNNLHIDIGDDIDMLSDSDFFHENMNKLFSFINSEHEDIFNEDSRKNKKKLVFSDDINDNNDNNDNNEIILSLDDITELDTKILKNIIPPTTNEVLSDNLSDNLSKKIVINEISELSPKEKDSVSVKSKSTNSEFSSRSSNTLNSKDNDTEDDNSDNDESYSDESSNIESIMVSLKIFPIQIIALENCSNTLDSLLVEKKISQEELSSAMIQVIMMLIVYQKLFNLTHNDLHTNNIMYIVTDRRFLYYKVNNKYYKVRTFGKIYKIIDFGRAIYKYKNKTIASDSFHPDGDASSQYNSEPYFNKDKPRIDPNTSFDLCRLGCSIYDFITEKYEKLEERYPDFKLYKMIARKVHNHVPIDELKNKHFDQYVVSKKEIKRGSKICNIDLLEINDNQKSLNINNLQEHSSLLEACD